MPTLTKYTYNYFLFLFSIIPITIILGSAVSVVNILIIDLSFIILIIYKKNFSFLKDKSIIYLFVLYFYLIINSFISLDYTEGLLRNFGFLRIIILFAAFNYFYHQKFFFNRMFKSWLAIILVVIFDVIIESTFGKNLLGYGVLYGDRIVSFFKDEPVVGGFLNGFFLVLISFYTDQKKNKYLIALMIILFISVIFLTGERSNSLRALIGVFIFLILYKGIDLKKKFLFFVLIGVTIFTLFLNSSFLKHRFINQLQSIIYQNNNYFHLYESGFRVFKNYMIFGVGNKNYRVESCKQNLAISSDNEDGRYYCSTHPHQIYFELLSEHGLIGTIVIFYIFYKLIFSKIKSVIFEKKYLKVGSFIYLIIVFIPILPSGAFFNNFMLTLFAINLSIFYASDKKSNIFRIK